jgi:hypothetical protein
MYFDYISDQIHKLFNEPRNKVLLIFKTKAVIIKYCFYRMSLLLLVDRIIFFFTK